MSDDITPISSDTAERLEQQAEARDSELRTVVQQEASAVNLEQWAAAEVLFTPREQKKEFKTLKDHLAPKQAQKDAKGAEKSDTARTEEISESNFVEILAQEFHKRNPELQKKTLLALRAHIHLDDSPERILEKIQSFYKDQYLVDEAIDFLIQAAQRREEMIKKYTEIKEKFIAQFGREITAGRNIAAQALAFSKKNLGTATALRDLYRDITGNPRNPYKLFEELTERFKFSDMKNIIDFILHSLGSDLKAKGPSISRSELQRLFGEARNMQAILGLFRFFFKRIKIVKRLFDQADLMMPSQVNFEHLAKLLIKLLKERYPSNEKILKTAFPLGISEEIAAQVIVFTQYRDALRHISPKLFYSERHRQDFLITTIETLSDLEDELEEGEEEEES